MPISSCASSPSYEQAMFYRRYAKRLFDVTIALMVLVLATPILLVMAALVRLRLGSPILFTQQRPGHHGQCYHVALLQGAPLGDRSGAVFCNPEGVRPSAARDRVRGRA